MATCTLPDGRHVLVDDTNVTLLDYYRGEGAVVELDSDGAPAFPLVFNGGDSYETGDVAVTDPAADAEHFADAAPPRSATKTELAEYLVDTVLPDADVEQLVDAHTHEELLDLTRPHPAG